MTQTSTLRWSISSAWRHARHLLPAAILAAAIAVATGFARVRLEQPLADLDRVDSLGRVALIDTAFSSPVGVFILGIAAGVVVAVTRLLLVRPALRIATGSPGPSRSVLVAAIAPVAAAGAIVQIGRAAFVVPGIIAAAMLAQVRFRALSESGSLVDHFRWSSAVATGNIRATGILTVLNLTPAAIAALFAGYSEVVVFSLVFVVVEPIAALYGAAVFQATHLQGASGQP